MKECPSCNAKFDDGKTHCPECGAKVDDMPPEEISGIEQLIAEYDSKPRGFFKKLKKFFSVN